MVYKKIVTRGIVNEFRIIYFALFFSFILILLSYISCCTLKYKKVKNDCVIVVQTVYGTLFF